MMNKAVSVGWRYPRQNISRYNYSERGFAGSVRTKMTHPLSDKHRADIDVAFFRRNIARKNLVKDIEIRQHSFVEKYFSKLCEIVDKLSLHTINNKWMKYGTKNMTKYKLFSNHPNLRSRLDSLIIIEYQIRSFLGF